MPLPAAVPRELSHTRQVTFQGYYRQDGLWDIEAQIIDTKPFSFPNTDRGGTIEAEEPLHNMSVRLTMDDKLNIHDIEVVTDHSPYNYCPGISSTYKKLIGERIAPGWSNKLKTLFGKAGGCTHITELLASAGTAAIQTIYGSRQKQLERSKNSDRYPWHLNTCYAMEQSSPVVATHWPEYYQPRVEKDTQ